MTTRSTETGAAPTKRLRIDTLNTEVRAREALDEHAVEEYAKAMRAGAEFPPVVVFRDRKILWLADGHHRVAAARRARRKEIRAEVSSGSRREALLYACAANAAHGVRRTNANKRLAVTLMLRDVEWCHWSNREIARRCAVDEGLVRRVRDELSADDPQVATAERKMVRAGKEQTQKAAGERKRRAFRANGKLRPQEVAAIRVDPRNGQEIATEYGVHKSQVSRIKNNLIHVDPGSAPGLAGLRRAWDQADHEARKKFVRWLWAKHGAVISAIMTEPRSHRVTRPRRVA